MTASTLFTTGQVWLSQSRHCSLVQELKKYALDYNMTQVDMIWYGPAAGPWIRLGLLA
jgi:hypothetical protein